MWFHKMNDITPMCKEYLQRNLIPSGYPFEVSDSRGGPGG